MKRTTIAILASPASLDHRPCVGFEGFPCTPPSQPPFGIVRVNIHGAPHHRATGH